MKQKLYFLVVLLLCQFGAFAQLINVGGINYSVTSATTVSVCCNGAPVASSVTIPATIFDGVATTYNVTEISASSFAGNSTLTTIIIPNSVTTIGNYAFSSCTQLISVSIGNSVTSIGTNAFNNCTKLASITIPNSVTSIGHSAFSFCTGLLSANIGSSVTSISANTFMACSNLASITIPNSVTSIGNSSFRLCSKLASVSIPNSVTSIEETAFLGCSILASVSIPNSVTSIGQAAFQGCSLLASLDISNSVTSIGNFAFSYCPMLTKVICRKITPLILDGDVFGGSTNLASCALYVPNGSLSAYGAAAVWQNFNSKIGLTIPTFTQVAPICAGATLAALPISSTNSVSGTWSPVLNNLTTTTYTFTPDAGQTADTATMTIVVNALAITPTASAQIFTTAKTVADLVPTPSATIKWYTVANGGTALTNATLLATGTYYVAATNVNGCESARTVVAVTMNIPGTHLNFDGVNDVVSLGSNLTTYFTGKNSVTLEAWVKPSTTSGLGVIIGNYIYPSNNAQMQMLLRRDGDTYNFFIDNGSGFTSVGTTTNSVVLNTWQHVTGTWDGTTMRIYINGTLINSASRTGYFPSKTNSFALGSNIINEAFKGDIDEVRIWDVARTAQQISASKNCELQGNEAGLKAYYKFNQGVGGSDNSAVSSVVDATSGANNGTLISFTKNGATSNFLSGSPIITGVTLPNAPTVTTPISYIQNNTAIALTATSGGTGLLWYSVATGGTGVSTAPIPSTATVGTTSYWVSSTNDNGCESARVEIIVTTTTPLPGTHLNFDGANDVVSLGSNLTTYFTGKNSVTLEAWVRPSTTAGLGVIIGNYIYPSNNGQMQMLLRRDGSTYNFFIDNGSGFTSVGTTANSVVLNTWQHVTGTWDGTTMRIYINGALINSASRTGSFPLRTNSFALGSNSNNEAFKGDIDEVRIWDVARTAQQIGASKNCELQGNEAGLKAYYKFNQGVDNSDNSAVSSVMDATSGANNGTLINFTKNGSTSNFLSGSPIITEVTLPNAPTVTTPISYIQNNTAIALTATSGGTGLLWYSVATGGTGVATAPIPSTTTVGTTSYWVSSTNANGCESARVEIVVKTTASIPGTHLNFDGVNDYITLTNEAAFDFTNQMTVEFWMNSNTTPTQWDALVAKGDNSWRVALTAAGKINYAGDSGFGDVASNAVVTDGNWHHVAVTYNGINAIIYIDGVQNASVSGTGNIANSAFNVSIGENLQASGRNYTGNMDEVRIWNIARTSFQISSARNCELQGNEAGLVAYFKFNQGIGGSNNSAVSSVMDATSGANNGTLINFTKNGSTSNFLSGSPIITGVAVPNAPTALAQSFCGSKTVANLVPTSSTNIKWYTAATGGSALVSTTALATGTYYVSETNANGCESNRTSVAITTNTMPTGITATLSASSGVSGSTFTAAATGVTSGNGLTVQWQKFVNESWTDIAGATSVNNVLTAETGAAGTNTNYRLKVTCTETNVAVYSTTVSYTLTLVYCAAGANNTTYEKIANVTLGTIDNNSTSTAGYEDFTAVATSLLKGLQHTVSISITHPDIESVTYMWIDFNQNGSFDDEAEHLFTHYSGDDITETITIPSNALLGATRMRIRATNLSGDNESPCGNTIYGQVEDYTVIISCPPGTWTGTTSTDWSTATNWCGNSVPVATTAVTIPNTANKPLMSSNTEIFSLKIQAGAQLNIANTLTVTQNIINEGQLIFKSNATSTGQLGVFNGTITGNGTATVERYIPAKRAWRALTAPLKGTNGSLFATWQNNGVVIPNVGAEIWGPSGSGLATGPAYSALEYTPTGYVDVTNTQTKNLFDTNKNNAYLMFVTGGYGSGNIATTQVAQPTTLSATGKLITGNVINSNINDVRHNLIGNPYASALNPATLLNNTTNLIQKFWVWDPHSGTSGGYVMYDKVAGTYNNITGSYPTGMTAVQSGQGFFVKATTGNTGSITLTESNKSSAVTNAVFSTNTPEIFRVGMYRQEAQNWLPLDGAIAVMYPSANPEVDENDGVKFANNSENIAFRRSNTSLSSEHHLPLVANDVLYIKVWNTTPNTYKLNLNTESFDATNLDAKLQDLYTNVDTVLNLDGSINEYLFNVTSDVASTNDRFRIVFQAKGALSTNEPTKNPFIIAPNPVTNQIVTVYFKDNQTQKLKYTLVNALGQLIVQGTVNSDNTINVANVATGIYVLQLQTENNEIYTSKLIIK